MNSVFADSFFFIALLVDSDEAHARAVQAVLHLNQPVITSCWVLAEVADALCSQRERHKVSEFFDFLDKHTLISVLPAEAVQFENGLRLYRSRADKDWSLTDCISFELMIQMGLSEALTADKHFEQAGFVSLLK